MTHKERVARNFIQNRGRVAFRKMMEMFESQESGQEIAKVLGVTRERVRQWRNTFGQTYTIYQPFPEVLAVAKRFEYQTRVGYSPTRTLKELRDE